jgi:pyruvate,water dikinase
VTTSYTGVPLSEARDEGDFGGKAVQLAAAIRAGLPVPPGVALAADWVAAVANHDPSATVALSDFLEFVEGPLAVRSSCVGEDSAAASFAGQHLTKLGVRTAEQLADAVRAVWESGCSEAALAYRRRLGLTDEPRMGVVIQQLVEAEVAGVLFTRNPVTGADERVIEAAWGLGESVVQGMVAPDLYRVGRRGEVLECRVGHKERTVRSLPGGATVAEPVSRHLVGARCLDDAALASLHRLALRCEESFEGPSDIEWALVGRVVNLLQRRRITGIAAWRPISAS